MLWTDEIFVTPDDLTIVDSEIQEIAEEEEVVLLGSRGFIRRQIDEAGEEILRRMEVFGGWVGSSTLSANHIQAVLNVGSPSSIHTKVLLNQVVVSDRIPDKWSHLKQWVAYRLLAGFYRNVYSRTASKDRFKTKLEEFTKLLQRSQNYAFEDRGLPICYQPLPRPGAAFEVNPGIWSSGNVSSVVDAAGTVAGDYDVVITYVDKSRYVSSRQNGNAESGPSDRQTITLTIGQVLAVDIQSLIPPDGIQDPGTVALCAYSPLTATHWNIYAGLKGGPLYLQNDDPILITTTSHQFTADPRMTGFTVGLGQYADRRYQFQHTLHRG